MEDPRYQNANPDNENLEEGTPTTASTPEDIPLEIIFGSTQGKKGHKAPRINMAFSPDNHEWIKRRSRQLGVSATKLVNTIIERERLK